MALGKLVINVYSDNIAQPINEASVNIIGENTKQMKKQLLN